MVSFFANLFLISAYVFCAFAAFGYFFAATLSNLNLYTSAKRATALACLTLFFCYGLLTYAFITNDFSVDFVYKNSSLDLPLFYKITGPWSGLSGSLLLWAILLLFFTFLLTLHPASKTRPRLFSYGLSVLLVIQFFLLSVILFLSNPVASTPLTASNGRGLNPLLQHPGMVVHPPLLYLGFIGISIPYAFAISSLILGEKDKAWIRITRLWSLAAWLFLTLGMVIGGLWAYHLLGWGGFWAWDPVENSSLMPWLAVTAYLHSIMVEEKTGNLKVWNVFLLILAFELTILGTFITRSGVLNSVHAFSNSNLGIFFLAFITLSSLFSFGLMIFRYDQLGSDYKTPAWFNKENFFLINNFLFLVVVLTVLYGTVYPLLSEGLFNRKISIQAPYFNSINLPLAILILIFMAITPLFAWQRMKIRGLQKRLLWPVVFATVLALLGYFTILADLVFALCWWVLFFASYLVIEETWHLMKLKKGTKAENKNQPKIFRRKLGGMLVHFAILLCFVSFLGKYLSLELHLNIAKGQVAQLGPYSFSYIGESSKTSLNVLHQQAVFKISKNGQDLGTLSPSKAFYPTSPEPLTVVDIHRTWSEDLYISLASINPDGSVGVNVFVNKWVLFLPISLIFFVVGVLFSASYREKDD